ncbi:MAG TPA: nucleoside-triphosphatase [bacterium]|nr:nucleoside-triphosphatase [bacterium]
MVYIITGKINQGKTSLAYSLYKSNRIGDGFLAPKLFVDSQFAGYQIQHLSSGEKQPMAFLESHLPENKEVRFRFQNFAFTEQGFELANSIIDKIIKKKISPVFIDEIGPVELFEKRGLYKLFDRVLQENCDVIVVVRNFLVERLLDIYKIRNYELIKA